MAAIFQDLFGTLDDGRAVERYCLRGESGFSVDVITLGATVTSLLVPDSQGHFNDVVLGHDTLQQYVEGHNHLGAVAGRYCNRIANSHFALDGHTYTLDSNAAPHHLHGGKEGFHRQLWHAQIINDSALRFSLTSPHDDQGYPGQLEVTVTYSLVEPGELVVQYEARTDRPTVINLTQHSYFNLAGHSAGDILEHTLQISSQRYATVNEDLVPTGSFEEVSGTPFDFTSFHAIGERIHEHDPQLLAGRGYDHSWALTPQKEPAAIVREANSRRELRVYTDQPALHVYTGNFLPNGLTGKHEATYSQHSGVCLETQHFADSPNQPQFPSTRLDPGQVFTSCTKFVFGTYT